jgi:hypothetical protein
MKKILILPFFVIVALVSQAWGAETWTDCPAPNNGFCKWGTACHALNTCTGGAAGSDCAKQEADFGTDCAKIYENCLKNSEAHTVWSNTTCTTEKEKLPIENCGVYCKWETGCTAIETNDSLTTCALAKTNCLNYSPTNSTYSNSTCTTVAETKPTPSSSSTPTPSSSSTPTPSSSSTPTPSSSSAPPPSSSSNDSSSSGISSSSDAGSSSSSSSGETDPIISYNRAPVVGLSVVNFARSLRIASDKNATISLFDINGKLVLSQKVLNGTTTIRLEKQKSGVYYAVAKSSSQKQIIKIVLK